MMKKNKIPLALKKAYQEALKARSNAHAPYSKYRVGAVLVANGKLFLGCNMENASLGGTICAERIAFGAANTQTKGRLKPEFMVVVTSNANPAAPCGLCLQVMAEFCPDTFPVYLSNTKGIQIKRTLTELLPYAFRSDRL